MTMRWRASAAFWILACQAAWGASAHWTLGNIPSDYQGRYGTAHTIGIFYDPTFLQYQNPNVRMKLTVPYIAVTHLPAGTKLTNGTVSAHSTNQKTTNPSGLGDIWLAAHYTLTPGIVPYAKVKFGTASARKGLGTGQNDYEFGLGLNTTIGRDVFPFAHVGYRFVGSPPGERLRNIATFDAGVSAAANLHNVFTVMVSGEQSEQPGYPGPRDAIVAWNYNVTVAGSGIQVYVDKGLSSGSARLGGGIGGQIVF